MPQPYDWNRATIEKRRSLLRMADLWDGNTYAAQEWSALPKHIQEDIAKILAFAGLEPRAIKHDITEDSLGYKCSCGFTTSDKHQIPKHFIAMAINPLI